MVLEQKNLELKKKPVFNENIVNFFLYNDSEQI